MASTSVSSLVDASIRRIAIPVLVVLGYAAFILAGYNPFGFPFVRGNEALALPLLLWAEPVSQLRPTDYVNDFAHVLDQTTVAQLDNICQQLDQKAKTLIIEHPQRPGYRGSAIPTQPWRESPNRQKTGQPPGSWPRRVSCSMYPCTIT
jgi:hypothetical protein